MSLWDDALPNMPSLIRTQSQQNEFAAELVKKNRKHEIQNVVIDKDTQLGGGKFGNV